MIITINGRKTVINAAPEFAAVLAEQGYGDKIVAVARNGTFVPRTSYAATQLTEGDEIEIVAPMQGG